MKFESDDQQLASSADRENKNAVCVFVCPFYVPAMAPEIDIFERQQRRRFLPCIPFPFLSARREK